MYFTCKKTPYPELAYRLVNLNAFIDSEIGTIILVHDMYLHCRQYNEPENHTDPDDGVDGRFGVYCTDAGFTNRKWPKEKECEKVPICKDLPKPCKI